VTSRCVCVIRRNKDVLCRYTTFDSKSTAATCFGWQSSQHRAGCIRKCKKENYIAGPAVHIPNSTVPVFYQTQAGDGKSHVLLVSHEKVYERDGELTGDIKQVQKRLCCKVLPFSAVVFRMCEWLYGYLLWCSLEKAKYFLACNGHNF
jgi:hypothetical protein